MKVGIRKPNIKKSIKAKTTKIDTELRNIFTFCKD